MQQKNWEIFDYPYMNQDIVIEFIIAKIPINDLLY